MSTISLRWGSSLYTFPISPGTKAYVLRLHRSRRGVFDRAEARRASAETITFLVAAAAPGTDWRALTIGLNE